MIQVACSACGARLKVPDEKAGSRGRCPKCKATVEIPEAEGPIEVVDEPAEDEAEDARAPRARRPLRPAVGPPARASSLAARPRAALRPATAPRPGAPGRPRSGPRPAAPKKKSTLVIVLAVVAAVVVLGGGGFAVWFTQSDEWAVARRTQGFCEALKKGDATKLAEFFPQRTTEQKTGAPFAAAAMIAFTQAMGGIEAYDISPVRIDGDRATVRVTLVPKKGEPDTDDMVWRKIDGNWYFDILAMAEDGPAPKAGKNPGK